MTVLEIIFLSILLVSLAGVGVILFRKLPLLVKIPEVKSSGKPLVAKIKKKIKKGMTKLPGAKKFDYELYLQKVLSRIRVFTLKTESKTGSWLEKLRQRRNNHNHNNNQYWEELKKAKDRK